MSESQEQPLASSELNNYFYYTRWYYKGDEDLDAGYYHSTFITLEEPSIFLSGVSLPIGSDYFIKRFETEEEMMEYWDENIRCKSS